MKENVARRPRFRRDPDFPKMRLTERDKAIISAVCRHRFLTTSLIVSLVPGSRQNIIRRLQRLYHAGFLDRPRAQLPLRYSGELSEFVYCPDSKSETGRGHRPVTSLFLAHTLMVSEILVRIESDCRLRGETFIPESEMLAKYQGEPTRRLQWWITVKTDSGNEQAGVIPDAAFAIDRIEPNGVRRAHYFLEADRGTMPVYRRSIRLSSIRKKGLAYSRTRVERILKERYGISGFQVIFVIESEERLRRIREVCRGVTGSRHTFLFIFMTLDGLRKKQGVGDELRPQTRP